MTELGPLPNEWRLVGFHGFFKKKPRGRNIPSIKMSEAQEQGLYPVIGQGSSFVEGYSDRADLLFPRDLLPVLIYGPHTRNVKIVGREFISGPNVRYLWPREGVDINFSYFAALNTKVPERGYNDHFPVFKQASFPLPPLPEQRAIAHVLRAVQRAREATEGVITALCELKKSLMQHLFTYGPVPVNATGKVELQETEISPLPTHWRVVQLGEVGKVVTGRTPSTARGEYWNNGSIPFITPVDLDGKPIRCASRTITREGLKEAKPLPRGSVLVSCIGYIGKIGVTDADLAVTNQQINAIIPRGVETWFLAYALTYESQLLDKWARMTTVPILNKTNFKRVPIPLPPLPEQREIAHILQTVDRKIEAEEQRKAAQEALFKTLLHDLMTAKRRLPAEFVAQFEKKTEAMS